MTAVVPDKQNAAHGLDFWKKWLLAEAAVAGNSRALGPEEDRIRGLYSYSERCVARGGRQLDRPASHLRIALLSLTTHLSQRAHRRRKYRGLDSATVRHFREHGIAALRAATAPSKSFDSAVVVNRALPMGLKMCNSLSS